MFIVYNLLTICCDRYCDHLQDKNPVNSLHARERGSVFIYVYLCCKETVNIHV